MQDFKFGSEDVLLSFDVVSLFTRVPLKEVLKVVEDRLSEMHLLPEKPLEQITSMTDLAILELLRHALDQCKQSSRMHLSTFHPAVPNRQLYTYSMRLDNRGDAEFEQLLHYL